ncbi:MAG: hypothetical protein AAF699_20545, partial [Pseudomonadota bacterium]
MSTRTKWLLLPAVVLLAIVTIILIGSIDQAVFDDRGFLQALGDRPSSSENGYTPLEQLENPEAPSGAHFCTT